MDFKSDATQSKFSTTLNPERLKASFLKRSRPDYAPLSFATTSTTTSFASHKITSTPAPCLTSSVLESLTLKHKKLICLQKSLHSPGFAPSKEESKRALMDKMVPVKKMKKDVMVKEGGLLTLTRLNPEALQSGLLKRPCPHSARLSSSRSSIVSHEVNSTQSCQKLPAFVLNKGASKKAVADKVIPSKKVRKSELVKQEKFSEVQENFIKKQKKIKSIGKLQEEDENSDENDGSVNYNGVYSDVGYNFDFERQESRTEEVNYKFPPVIKSIRSECHHFFEEKQLLNLVSCSLIKTPDFRLPNDDVRNSLFDMAKVLAVKNPEFILKLALYTRKHLNIRQTTNFLLAFSATDEHCKRFMDKYFNAAVVLPSDWIEVAEIAMTLGSKGNMTFPSSLRRAMAKKFPDFDTYQLGKYNKESSRKKKKKVDKSKTTEESETPIDESKATPLRFTLKQLIRKIHINEPVSHIMCIIGKKYPSTMEEFFRSRLPGLFEEGKAGKRMKLPTPETWETQISSRGNKAEVWQDLIDHKKLPFMAMLRNLRNLILAGISDEHHSFVLNRLQNEEAVINSKQFPFRFLSAYSVINEMATKIETTETPAPFQKKKKVFMKSKKTFRKGKFQKKAKKVPILDQVLLKKYMNALDRAIKISTNHNVPPIPGRTFVFCDLSSTNNSGTPCPTSKGLGKTPKSIGEMAVLLSLMCKWRCEDCTLFVCGLNKFETVEIQFKDSILKNVENILKLQDVINSQTSEAFSYIGDYMNKIIYERVQINNWILLNGYSRGTLLNTLTQKFDSYRELVNNKIQGFHINLSFGAAGVSDATLKGRDGPVEIYGFSDQVLRFIADRGDENQVTFVDNIDLFYKLHDPKLKARIVEIPEVVPDPFLRDAPKWVNCRIFISSTFLDMFSERDLLVRYIFQELKARCKSIFVNIFEVDLRWGISEEESQNSKTIQLCLTEVSKCNFFVGMLGERYGWCPDTYGGIDALPELDWLANYPKGASLTELEFMQCFKKLNDYKKKAFFYFRDASLLREVPKKYQHLLADDKAQKLKFLKNFVCRSGAEVYENYPCSWGGADENGKPVITNLEEFGLRVLQNLWNAIQEAYPVEDRMETDGSSNNPFLSEDKLHLSYINSFFDRFVGRQNLLNKFLDFLSRKKSGLLIVAGKPGSGKSALMAAAIRKWQESQQPKALPKLTIVHCAGASPDSDNILFTINRLISEMRCRIGSGGDDDGEKSKEWRTFEAACQMFRKVLTDVSKTNRVQIFIDGADYFSNEHLARSMTWLPEDIPMNVLFVISVNENSEVHLALKDRSSVVGTVEVGALDPQDKQAIVRSTLKEYSKSLNESLFNNQMRMITMKKESSSPLYLSLLCEEMRQFGEFEQVSSKISSFSATLPKLILDVIDGLERSHGEDMVKVILSCLVCSPNGLKEHEIQEILSAALPLDWTEITSYSDIQHRPILPERMVSPARVLFFIRSIQHFLRPLPFNIGEQTEVTLFISHKLVISSITQRYFSSLVGKKYEKFIHMLLASYFYQLADPQGDCSWTCQDVRPLAALTHHLCQCCHYQSLAELLTDLTFLRLKFSLGLSSELLEDYNVVYPATLALKKDYELNIGSKKFKDYRAFVYKNCHLLSSCPQLIIQQALAEDDESEPCKDANHLLLTCPSMKYPCTRLLNKNCFKDLCVQTFKNNGKISSCLALSSDDRTLASGYNDASIELFDTQDFKKTLILIGHSGAITSLCFVSNQRLCSASKDETLSLWSVSGGYRLAVMEGHKRQVNCCMSDNLGSIIVSVGWDALVQVWHGVTGVLETTLPRKRCPLNCVSIHPEGQIIVIGDWESTIFLYDILQKKRRAVLRGHRSSVRDVRFNPSGVHIVSSDMWGDVMIWSSKYGCMVGLIKGHSLPVNKVLYSPSGELLTGSDDGTIKVWSGSMGCCTNIFGEMSYGPATCVVLDPFSSSPVPLVAVGYYQGSVRMFSCATGELLWEKIQPNPPSAARCLAFKMVKNQQKTGESKLLAVGKADGVCMLLNASNGHIVDTLVGHSKAILTLACTNISKNYIITAGEDCLIFVYNCNDDLNHQHRASNKDPSYTLQGHSGPVTGISLNPSEDLLASVGHDGLLIIWDMDNMGTIKHRIYRAHYDWITCCSWSSCGEFLVTGSNDFTLKLWHVATGEERQSYVGHMSMISGVAYKKRCILSSSTDGCLKVWSQKGVEISTLQEHHAKCNACDLYVSMITRDQESSSDPQDWESMMVVEDVKGKEKPCVKDSVDSVVIASCYEDGTVRTWNPLESSERHSLIGHMQEVISLAAGHSGLVCSGSADGSLKMWKLPGLAQQHLKQVSEASSSITSVGYSSGLDLIFASTRSGHVKIWSSSQMKDLLKTAEAFVMKVSNKAIYLYILSNDKVVTYGDDLELILWNVSTKKGSPGLEFKFKLKLTDYITCMDFVSQTILFATHIGGAVSAWKVSADLDSLVEINSCFRGSEDCGMFCASSTTGRLYMTSRQGWKSHLIEIKSNKAPAILWTHPKMGRTDVLISFLCFEDHMGRVFIGMCNGCVSVFDDQGVEVGPVRLIHSDKVTGMLLSFGTLFTCSLDGYVKALRIPECKVVAEFKLPSPVTSMALVSKSSSENANVLVCGTESGQVLFLESFTPQKI